MLNLFRSARNRLRPVWITFLELFYVFFQHENRFRYKFFDIVQFSRSCAPQPTGWRLSYFITEVIFCQALFSKRFERSELGSLQVSRNKPWACRGEAPPFPSETARLLEHPTGVIRCFATAKPFSVYWFFSFASQPGLRKSFFCLSAWRSSIIP